MKSKPRPLRVLVVDDDDKILRLLQLFLRQQGYVAETAVNGREALRMMLAQSYDLLIVDIQMPVMDGLTFSEEVRAVWPWQEIIFCTGHMNDPLLQKSRDLGVRQILEKPISFNTLQNAITQTHCLRDTSLPDALENPASLLGGDLGALRRFTQTALEHMHFGHAVRDFSKLVFSLVDCRAASTLILEQGSPTLHVISTGPMSTHECDALVLELQTRFALLGESDPSNPPKAILRSESSEPLSPNDETWLLHAPVSGKNKILGLITISLNGRRSDTPPQLPTLLLAAHHFSTVLMAIERFQNAAMHDPLTGLFNRRYVEESLEKYWLLTERHQEAAGILLVDLDGFRKFNQTHGAEAGDGILLAAATLLTETLRRSDVLARLSGDEFLIMVPRATPQGLHDLSTRILARFRETPLRSCGRDHTCTVTIGHALSGPETGINSLGQLLECADQALYTAKRQGGDREGSWQEFHSTGGASCPRHPILVVDDDAQVHHLIRRMLNPVLYDVTSANSVASGLALLVGGARFEMLLTDLALPNEDGTEMLRKSHVIDPDMVRVVISGNISQNTEGYLRSQGAFDIIQKPFHPQLFRTQIARGIEDRARRLRRFDNPGSDGITPWEETPTSPN